MTTHRQLLDIPYDDMTDEQRRELALDRLRAKSGFKVHLLLYAVVNATLVTIWAFIGNVLGADPGTPLAFFWPVFPILGWGVAILIQGYTVYRGNIYTEEQIRRELGKIP